MIKIIVSYCLALFMAMLFSLSCLASVLQQNVIVSPCKESFQFAGFHQTLGSNYNEKAGINKEVYDEVGGNGGYIEASSIQRNDASRWWHTYDGVEQLGVINNNLEVMRQLFSPSTVEDEDYDWLLITLLFFSLAAVTLLAGWPGQRRFGYLVPLISVTSTVIIIILAVALYREQEMEHQKQETLIKLSRVRVQLEESLNSTVFLIKGLVAHIQLNPDLTQAEFEHIARELIDSNPAIRNIGAAPDMVIRMVYPLEGNQQVLGLDYRELTEQWPSVLRARELDQIVLAGPQKLVQGGTGLIGQLPIYIQKESGERVFWGLVSTVLHVDEFYRIAGLFDTNLGLDFAIRGKDGMGEDGAVFFGNKKLFNDEQSVMLNIFVPGGNWQIAAKPSAGWVISSRPFLLIYLFGFMSVLLAIVSYYIRRSYDNQQVKNEQHIAYLAYHDSLTGLPNRSQFMEELERELAHAQRSKTAIAVLMLDLDHFKQINDTLGHALTISHTGHGDQKLLS